MKLKTCHIGLLAALLITSASITNDAQAQSDETRRRVLLRWNLFITLNLKPGMTEKELLNKIHGLYITSGRVHLGGTGAYYLVVRIDDFTHLTAYFDGSGLLAEVPQMVPASKFFRYPDGSMEMLEGNVPIVKQKEGK